MAIEVGTPVLCCGEGGAICAKRLEYHEAYSEEKTLVTICWYDGHQSQHLLEDFTQYGGTIETWKL
jgi:hypothetical protein